MIVNWKVRFTNKTFWLELVPAVLLLVQLVLNLFGVEMDFGDLGNKLVGIVNAVFGVLTILGVVNDPTTFGSSDSLRALSYEKPFKD